MSFFRLQHITMRYGDRVVIVARMTGISDAMIVYGRRSANAAKDIGGPALEAKRTRFPDVAHRRAEGDRPHAAIHVQV